MTKIDKTPAFAKSVPRIEAIDAVRGFAIIAMCISHVGDVIQPLLPLAGTWMQWLGLVATPAFLLLSGVSSGYVLKPTADLVRRMRFYDRALFLLVVAHAVLGLCHMHNNPTDWVLAFASIYITDVIAVALCLAVAVRAASGKALIVSGVAFCAATVPIAMWWRPVTPLTDMVDQILLHGFTGRQLHLGYTVPVVAYLGLFLIGFGVSRVFRTAMDAASVQPAIRRFAPLAIAGTTMSAVALLMAVTFLLRRHLTPETHAFLWRLIDPRMKVPPGFGYLLFFSGATLLVYSLITMLEHLPRGRVLVDFLSCLGRASLMVYLLQTVIIYFLPAAFSFVSIGSLAFWITYLALTIVVLWVAARWWGRHNGNRWISVGLSAWANRSQSR